MSFKLRRADLLEICSSELSQLKNDILILDNNICNQIFSQRPRQTGKWSVFCRLRPRTAFISSSSPPGHSVQTGVGWRHCSKLLVNCIQFFFNYFSSQQLAWWRWPAGPCRAFSITTVNVVLITVQSLYESPQQKLRNLLAATVSRDITTKRAPAS